MEEIRDADISRNAETVEVPEAPHFVDDEATLLARPVVPLTEHAGPYAASGSAYGARHQMANRFSTMLLVLIVAAAISVGAAGALALDYFRHHRSNEAQPTNPPAVSEGTNNGVQPQPIAEAKRREPQTAPTEHQPDQSSAGDKPNPSETKPQAAERPRVVTTSPTENTRTREKREQQPSDADEDERPVARKVGEIVIPTERQERRERRRRAREADDEILTQPVKRTNQELNRIREIFEGKQP